MVPAIAATYFATPAELQAWFDAHHASAAELIVGFYKKGTGQPSITWPESVDEALCVGWIDGVRRRVDDARYCIRFTPRKARSIWSEVNVKRVAELTSLGRMRPAGLAAYERRTENKTGIYAYEQKEAATLTPDDEARFRADPAAWAFFQAQPAGYRRTAIWHLVSAKKPETRERRLIELIADSAAGRTIKSLTRP